MEERVKHPLSTPRIMVLGFLLAILAGSGLLMLPFATAPGETTTYLDALFTATTSVCVTGLVTVTTAAHWTLFGKLVILVLIQLGGLGVVTVSLAVLILLGQRITLRERMVLQDTYGMDSPGGMVRFVKKAVLGTFAVEGLGALLLSFYFVPKHGAVGIWYSIFHAISAFCNAGIDILGENSMGDFVVNPYINLVLILLIVVSGIGFIVWWDVVRVIREKRQEGYAGAWSRLQLHSKLAIMTSLILIVGGTLTTLVFEWNNPDSIGTFTFGGKFIASAFQSVTTRTAGFLTIPQENFTRSSVMVYLILMLIGGSPAGTAGGIKTTTIAMLFLIIRSQMRGKRETEAFGRRISSENLKMALAILGNFFLWIFIALCILFHTESLPAIDLIYEVCSAIGTVGLSRGITAILSPAGKTVIIFLMFLGRLGPITTAMALTLRREKNGRKLLEQRILIG